MSVNPYLGINVNAASVAELRYRGLLEEGETLLALFDGVLLDEQRRRVGGIALSDYLALTDRRVVTWARGFFNDTVDGFRWQDIDVAHAETWDPWHGRVSLLFRLPAVAPRKRRIAVNGSFEDPGVAERTMVNTLDYMPADDVQALAAIIEWVGDQISAGVEGEELLAAFAAQFPGVEREPLQPFFTAPEPVPPPAPEPTEPTPRRRWWQGAAPAAPESAPLTTPGNLIAAYEAQRRGAPAGSGPQAVVPSAPVGPLPTLPEQPSMYEVSRSLRLLLEAPKRLARGLRRANEAVGGASELMSGLQDPRVRRNAMRGLYHAAAQQEADGGPLASVGPVVRAAVRFAEPVEQPSAEESPARRIQVKAGVRRAPSQVPVEQAPPPAAPAQAAPAAPEPVRRTISVRRVDVGVSGPQPVAEPPPPVETPRVAPVRRIAVTRPEREHTPHLVSLNGNGKHEE